MSTEERLLLLLCQWSLFGMEFDKIQDYLHDRIVNFDVLSQLCQKHRLFPLYIRFIEELSKGKDGSNPPTTRKIFELVQQARYTLYKKQASELFDVFNRFDIKACIIKGISYYGEVYTGPQERQLGDIDIVVHHEDMSKAVECLWELGYTASDEFKGWSSQRFQEESYMSVHVAQFRRGQIEIELHAGDEYYCGLNLQNVLDRAVCDEKGIFIPQLADIFLVACAHAWHHYPIRKFQLSVEQCQLGQLYDVIKGYQALKRDYEHEEIMHFAEINNITDIVNFIMFVAYTAFDKHFESGWIQADISPDLDWVHAGTTLTLLRRYFRPKECIGVMEEWFANDQRKYAFIHADDPFPIYTLPYILEVQCGESVEHRRWANNILEANTTSYLQIPCRFNINWNEEGLIITFQSSDLLQWGRMSNKFDYFSSYLVLRFSESLNKEAVYIIMQLIEEKIHVFKWPKGEEWRYNTINVCAETRDWNLEDIHQSCIPWRELNIEPSIEALTDREFYIDLQMRQCYKENGKYVDIMWIGGNNGTMWREFQNANNMGIGYLSC